MKNYYVDGLEGFSYIIFYDILLYSLSKNIFFVALIRKCGPKLVKDT